MRTIIAGCILVAVILILGCQWSSNLGSEADSDLARETLIAALDAWKLGQTKELDKRDPPIRFADDDQRAGMQLIEYELDQPGQRIVPFLNVRVELLLRDHRGQTSEKTATYQIGIEPKLTVLRSNN